MSDEQRRARPAAQYGPTAATVAENVQRLRKRHDLSIYQLSALLRKAGRPITPAAVGKIERQQRQVTVDDLSTLAVIFKVSPSALLLPLKDAPTDVVEVTGAGEVSGEDAWDWADGLRPLRFSDGDTDTQMLEYDLNSRPSRRRRARTLDPRLVGRPEVSQLIQELAKDGRSGWVVNPALLRDESIGQEEGD
ncbi:helix-turn-helix domain-containing protein [Streptomyces sp. NPDC060002]|uniref:helix-turn-helix domain-containing protein n=1 Tax=Streptomyces sp. NPDC060002 TaxID=3347033 RepID=UPI00367CF7C3